MASPLKSTTPKLYDEAKLQAMIEPLTVRVEKLHNGRRQPIPLPESEETPGLGGGIGYDKQAIRDLEQFIVTEWSGGGYYEIKVTDANGAMISWNPSWDIGLYPEKVPPPLQGAFNSNPPASKRIPMAPAFSNGFPSFQQMQQPQFQQPQPQYGQPYYPPMPPPPMVGTPQYAMWSNEAKDRSESAELRALREENQRRERESIEIRHKAELERDRQATEARFNAQTNAMTELRNMITVLTATIQSGVQQRKPDDALEAMKLQMQQQQAQAEAERREREQDRRERETRDMIKGMQEASQKQIDAMTRQLEAFQASLAAANANKQDPMIEMLREQARQSAESIKEVSRANAASMERMQVSMLNPRDILALAKESSTAADQVTDKLTHTFSKMIDMQQKVTENALNLQPQGSPIVDMVRDGASHVKEMAERYFGKAELQAKLAAGAQENLLHAQRDVQIAQIHAQNPGLAGVQHQHQVEAGPQMVQHQAPKKTKGSKKPIVDANGQPAKVRKILGKTDHEWFGPITDDIGRLRAGVAEYLESIKTDPPRVDKAGEIVGVSAEQAGQVIAQGTAMVVQAGADIPAMTLLLFQQRFPDFMDVVLPDAPEQFRTDVINVLVPLLRGEVGGGAGMTGEPKPEEADDQDPPADGEGDEADTDGDDDNNSDADADDKPNDGDDAKPDGGETAAKPATIAVPMLRSIGPNGKPTNPPRRT